MIDFETAVEFAPDCPPNSQVCTGLPIGAGFATENYARRHAPEFASGSPYNPFKLDIWQLGTSLVSQFQVRRIRYGLYYMSFMPRPKAQIPAIDQILLDMTRDDPEHRTGAQVALDRLRNAVYSLPAESLLIQPYTRLQSSRRTPGTDL